MMYGNSATVALEQGAGTCKYRCAPSRTNRVAKGLDVMELIVFGVFFLVLALLSALGWVADSRDGADWTPTEGGLRRPRRI
jgi:hypothetical protein